MVLDKYSLVQHATHPSDPPHTQFPHTASHDLYDTVPNPTPSSSAASTFPMGTPQPQPSFPVSPNFFHQIPPLPDLSSVMFPSTDPFAYPNQAMTAFENAGYGDSKESVFYSGFGAQQQPTGHLQQQSGNGNGSGSSSNSNSNMLMGPSASLTTPPAASNSDLDVQLFGPMPMYLMQGGGGGGQPAQMHHQPDVGMHAAQQAQRTPGQNAGAVNLDELFGGEGWVGGFSDFQGGPGLGGGGTGMEYR